MLRSIVLGWTLIYRNWFIHEYEFSNSLIIHEVKTKQIATVKEVWITGLN